MLFSFFTFFATVLRLEGYNLLSFHGHETILPLCLPFSGPTCFIYQVDEIMRKYWHADCSQKAKGLE